MGVRANGDVVDEIMMRRLESKRVDLEQRKNDMIAYCLMKLRAGDWHAVQDAASDIREIDAQLDILRDLA